jgi:hypothetical protein
MATKLEELREEYLRLSHAMQSGVAMQLAREVAKAGGPALYNGACAPKHLRVGVNTAMSDAGGLVTLLISKGVITEEEYTAAVVEAMRREVAGLERELTEDIGTTIRLA